MKLASFHIGGEDTFGVIKGDGVADLGARLGREGGLREILRQDNLPALKEFAEGTATDYALDDIKFLPTVPNPEKIVCIGVNYVNRNEEYRDNSDLPKYPSVFMRTRESLVGHREHIVRPPESMQLDYEGEIAMIIGKEGRRIPEEEAGEHIAGLSVMNEGSIRDWLRHAKFNVTQGKNFERTGALGPWMVTADEFEDYGDLRVRTRVNGEERQNDTTANLLFPFPYLISYLSTFMRLKPGDVIATGTPSGAGARFDPPRYLNPGDLVEVEVAGVGTLANEVVDEQAC